ncbi:MAG TPA: coenzyme F420-0:L-glutamate ligase [Egibacteraceae bacterium]|nr:coenzyme F420-0:L-glutamate ligase [Egibacteraceae bacterium]
MAGLPEIRPGDDLAGLVAAAAALRDGDVVVVAQKVVSKAEGALARPRIGETTWAARRRLAREQAVRVVADAPHVLVVETGHGFVCANAGVDASNLADGQLTLLPDDPDASARRLRAGLEAAAGVRVAVVVSDTFGRPWRLGQTDVAIGAAGLRPIRDERGSADRHGARLEVTETAVADELAGAADLVRRKADGLPVVIVRGLAFEPDDAAGARALVRPASEDLFPRGRGGVADALAAGRDPAGGGPVGLSDLHRALRAAAAVAGGAVRIQRLTPPGAAPTVLAVRGQPLPAGLAAGALVAALVDLGYAAAARPARAGEDAAAVVEAGQGEPDGR